MHCQDFNLNHANNSLKWFTRRCLLSIIYEWFHSLLFRNQLIQYLLARYRKINPWIEKYLSLWKDKWCSFSKVKLIIIKVIILMFLPLVQSMILEFGMPRIDKSYFVSKYLILNVIVLPSWMMVKVLLGFYKSINFKWLEWW